MKLVQQGTDVEECSGCGALARVYEYGVGDVSSPTDCRCDSINGKWRWVVWADPTMRYRYSRCFGESDTFAGAVSALIVALQEDPGDVD